jgi:hypothetical protein
VALPAKLARPPRGDDVEDWKQWAEEVERVVNLLLTRTTAWGTISNVTTDRAYDANATSLDELADALGTLVSDLKAKGVIQ